MSTSNLAIRFTDETYASRPEVAKALGTNLIDSIWLQIVSYRRTLKTDLKLLNVYKIPYSICNTASLKEKTHIVEDKLLRVFSEFDILNDGSIEKETLRSDMLKIELKSLARAKGIIINDIALENIISGKNTEVLYEPLVRYLNALNALETSQSFEVNEEFIAKYLEILNGGGELLSFYRTKEFTDSSQKVLINREYEGAPINVIEDMMNALLNFAIDENVPLIIRLSGVSYGINYIKPFESFNDEIAILLMKSLIAQANNGHSILLPLETILVEGKDSLCNASKETQKNSDLTYYSFEFLKLIEEAEMMFLNRTVQVSRDAVENAFFERETAKTEVESPIKEEKPIIEEPIKQPEQEIVIKEVKTTPKKVVPANNEPKVNVKVFAELDEKALRRAAEDLLESDPTLRPSQAHFYVRHCTMGKYYTIQQFKKTEGCVYETARTSMDNLARAGYYRREQVKNKFVYTPISKE